MRPLRLIHRREQINGRWRDADLSSGWEYGFLPAGERRFRRALADFCCVGSADGFLKSSPVLPVILRHIVYLLFRFL